MNSGLGRCMSPGANGSTAAADVDCAVIAGGGERCTCANGYKAVMMPERQYTTFGGLFTINVYKCCTGDGMPATAGDTCGSGNDDHDDDEAGEAIVGMLFVLGVLGGGVYVIWQQCCSRKRPSLAATAIPAAPGQQGVVAGQGTAEAQTVAAVPLHTAQVVQATSQATMQVQVPAGASPGATLQVQAPDGQAVQFTVPVGALPGQTITIATPPPLATATATAVVQP